MELEAELDRQAEVERMEEQKRKMREVAHYNAITEARKKDEAARRAQEDMMILQVNLEAHRQETEQQRGEKVCHSSYSPLLLRGHWTPLASGLPFF